MHFLHDFMTNTTLTLFNAIAQDQKTDWTPPDNFDSLPNSDQAQLVNTWMTKQRLEKITSLTFKGQVPTIPATFDHVTALSFSDWVTLPYDAFHHLPKLKEVTVEGASCACIPETMFNPNNKEPQVKGAIICRTRCLSTTMGTLAIGALATSVVLLVVLFHQAVLDY